jgi:hypothetical protein
MVIVNYQKRKLNNPIYNGYKNKILRNKLNQGDLYIENSKTLTKEIEEDTKKWKDISCSWIVRINNIKMLVWPKVIHRSTHFP